MAIVLSWNISQTSSSRQPLVQLLHLLVFRFAFVHTLPAHLSHFNTPLLKLGVIPIHQLLKKGYPREKHKNQSYHLFQRQRLHLYAHYHLGMNEWNPLLVKPKVECSQVIPTPTAQKHQMALHYSVWDRPGRPVSLALQVEQNKTEHQFKLPSNIENCFCLFWEVGVIEQS